MHMQLGRCLPLLGPSFHPTLWRSVQELSISSNSPGRLSIMIIYYYGDEASIVAVYIYHVHA